ncbi:hypothetical protein QOZ80_1BG0085790 [Eleusine coracana subsp. coracana]|nr:hypothetical protein QOZ80_1BG0085790 [Eleusine coracana subsp. coracana]
MTSPMSEKLVKGVLRNGAVVAVKNLFSRVSIQEKQFKNEVKNLMKVRNQNIVRFVGYCCETWEICMKHCTEQIFAEMPQRLLCFEYMPKGSLDKYISDEPSMLDWYTCYKIIKGICCGLHYLHEKCHIIHLDLKPANILLDENMVPKIADFGTSKFFGEQKTHTLVTTREGTLGYMAPEYINIGEVTTKVDIYSLGIIIVEMVGGRKIKSCDWVWLNEICIEVAYENLRNYLKVSPSDTTTEIEYQQKVCLEIGLNCIKHEPKERPSIREIIGSLDIIGYVSNEERLPEEQETSKWRAILPGNPLLPPEAPNLPSTHCLQRRDDPPGPKVCQASQPGILDWQETAEGEPQWLDPEKRGYKLQDFVAHDAEVRSLAIGKKSNRVFITGGSDCKVNLWAIGKQTPILSLSGHTSSVEAVQLDSTEVIALAGSSNGSIKAWDLEKATVVQSFTGHMSSCTGVDFHPFGEIFVSGSSDTDLKIWDIKKKGCLHTYKGYRGAIKKIKFTPDGRWVVTGGEDNTVKVWDMTAGKLLHDFKSHSGQIHCIDFHPRECLLATGSADRTVKFWDLETFELIGSAEPEYTDVRAMVFHPDGKTILCGLGKRLKEYSWEPIICHDVVDMGWTNIAELSIREGKLMGFSYHECRVGVWVADASPYRSF